MEVTRRACRVIVSAKEGYPLEKRFVSARLRALVSSLPIAVVAAPLYTASLVESVGAAER